MHWQDAVIIISVLVLLISLYYGSHSRRDGCFIHIDGATASASNCSPEQLSAISHGFLKPISHACTERSSRGWFGQQRCC
ncbi:triple gene block protein 3 [Cnidium virus X]|uniref:Movement protein TGBp3 n=1 Tax=Cnidium virus X TaxID=2510428 RepID=A0A455TN60_9VIRU|nr:triple gene block protein 3 [Cnidium virus X]QVW10169.1 triple gene block protein 3 [Cnidium virus X]BBI37363.1 triple gene block protein 3 [Cnidium virus X]